MRIQGEAPDQHSAHIEGEQEIEILNRIVKITSYELEAELTIDQIIGTTLRNAGALGASHPEELMQERKGID